MELAPASRIGLRAWDVVTHVNGVQVRTVQEFQAAMAMVADGGEVVFSLRRYALVNGQPTPMKDAQGNVVRDERGLCTWEYTTTTITGKRGFMGINLEAGRVPNCEEE